MSYGKLTTIDHRSAEELQDSWDKPKLKIATIHHLAQSVFGDDRFNDDLSIERIRAILSLALNGVVRTCEFDFENVARIDLGNGYVMKCSVEYAGN